MPVRTACTSCGKALSVKDELAGKKVKCPGCGTAFLAVAVKAGAPPKAPGARPTAPAPVKDKVTPKAPPKRPAPPPPPMEDEDEEEMEERPARARKAAPPPIEDDEDEDLEEMEERPTRRGKAPAKSGGGKKWIWIALVLLILVAGGVGGYLWWLGTQSGGFGPIAKKTNPVVPPEQPGQNIPQPEQVPATGDSNLAALVPGDALFFASLSGEVLNAKFLEGVRKLIDPKIEQEFEAQTGIALTDLDRVSVFSVASVEEAKKMKAPPFVALVQTKKAFDQQKLLAAFKNSPLGKDPGLVFEFLDDKTVVGTLQPFLQMYKDKRGKQPPAGALQKALAAAGTSKGLVISVTIPPEAAMEAEKTLPPRAVVFAGPFLKTREVFLSLELTDKIHLGGALLFDDANSAKEAKTTTDGLVGLASLKLADLAKDSELAPLAQIGTKALGDLKIEAKDKELTLAFQADPAVLMAVILPAVEKVKKAAATSVDMNNLKQIGLAWHNFHDVHKMLPPQTWNKGLSWRVAILPYIEQQNLYQQFKLDEPWDSEHNKKLIPLMPAIYASTGSKAPPGFTHIQSFVGPKTINKEPGKGMKFAQIPDGTSNTLIVAEATTPVEWTKPADIEVGDQGPIQLGASDPAFFLGGFADGSVRRLSRKLDEKLLRLLIDPADGTPLPPEAFGVAAPPRPGVALPAESPIIPKK